MSKDNYGSLSSGSGSVLNFLSSVRIALWLLILLALTLFVGSFYAKYDTVYKEINYHLLSDWFSLHSIQQSWWIYLLLLLFALLFINTLACIVKRLTHLFSDKAECRFSEFCTSLIHCFFLIIVFGFALSEFTGLRQHIPATPGASVQVDNRQIVVVSQQCDLRPKGEKGPPIIGCSAVVSVSEDNQITQHALSLLHPQRDNGLSFHLGMAGKPKIIDKKVVPQVEVVIKKDYGLSLILAGDIVLCLSLLLHFVWFRRA